MLTAYLPHQRSGFEHTSLLEFRKLELRSCTGMRTVYVDRRIRIGRCTLLRAELVGSASVCEYFLPFPVRFSACAELNQLRHRRYWSTLPILATSSVPRVGIRAGQGCLHGAVPGNLRVRFQTI